MRSYKYLFNLFFCIFLSIKSIDASDANNIEYVKDEIFIRFHDTATETQREALAKSYSLVKIKSFFITKAILYRIEGKVDAKDLVLLLNENPFIKYADLNRKGYELQSMGESEPLFSNQWYLSGDYLGIKTNTIKWKEAMSIYSSKKEVGVAVIDSGIANYHPDLVNVRGGMTAEQNGIPNQDDDGFGLIDDGFGWNFVDSTPYPEDDYFHGTLVAGIIAGDSKNQIGITGIAPDSFIVPLKVMSATGDNALVSDLRLLSAIEYSVIVGVKIINLSMKFISPLQYSQVLQDAAFELSNQYDSLLICAAGNDTLDNDSLPLYPASYDGDAIISVAASDIDNSLAPFSHYGKNSVDLAAPGVAIFGPTISKRIIAYDGFDNDNGWTWGSGPYNQSNYRWSFFTAPSDGSTWVTDSDWDVYGNPLNYTASTNNFLSSPWIDLTSVSVPKLSVKIYHDLAQNWLLGSHDLLHFEISTDEINWYPIGLPVYGTTLYPGRIYNFDLRAFGGNYVKIRFRLATDSFYQADGVFIDDFMITGVSPFSYSGSEFEFSQGTSFAAPIVSGVAAMLLSHRPELSTQDVRKIILQSVTKVDGLADKVASGGIINAYEAIKLADAWQIESDTPQSFTLSSSVSPENSGTTTGSGSYQSGSAVSISASPQTGYQFSHWSDDASGSQNPLSITINQDTSIIANFSEIDESNEWSNASNLGNGWKSFSWFGSFYETNSNWIYHLKLGWIYRHGDNLSSLWFYSSKLGWIFTSNTLFPYLYVYQSSAWAYLQDDQLFSWANSSWSKI